MNPTTVLAEVIVDQLILNGVKEVVVAPDPESAQFMVKTRTVSDRL